MRCSAELSREDQNPDAVWEPERNADQRAYDLVHDAIRHGPAERAWALVTAVLQTAPDERLGHFAAGPLEDLVKRHGNALVDEIEAEATRDERFAWALGGIWLREADLPKSVLERLFRASGGRLQVLEWLPLPSDETAG